MPVVGPPKRVFLALAALHLRRDELDGFMRFAMRLGAVELHRVLQRIEQDMLLAGIEYDSSKRKETIFRSASANEVVNRVLVLLKNEARLSSGEIIDGLTEILAKENEVEILPRFVAKKSVADWLSAVTKAVGPSRMLQAATMLRNRRVHDKISPWPLDKSE
jgi:hypothetical protein